MIETLFAVFLTALCAIMLSATMPIATQSREKSNLLTRATNLAQKEIESVRGIGYANLTANQLYTYRLIDSTNTVAANTYTFTDVDSGNGDSVGTVLPTGTGRIKVEQVDLDLKRITVTISYDDRGTTRSVSLGTLVANL
ncbi:MAG: hypothetical protein JST40_08435 [Armatimonadetes bacterium]|nr:hypothetical protein [Armatimonadota bacterium]